MAITMFGFVGEEEESVEIVPWATGDIDKIKAMLDANEAGKINITDYWAVGEYRTVAYTSSILGDSSADWVLTDLSTAAQNKTTSGGTRYNAVIHTKKCSYTGYGMNSSNINSGGWSSSRMRTTEMPAYLAVIPSTFKALFKSASIISGAGNASNTTQTTTDTLWLFAEKEVFGTYTYSGSVEAGYCKQYDYFKTASNRIKYYTGTSAYIWWLRSPKVSGTSSFCYVYSDGSAYYYSASFTFRVAPAAII